MAINHPFLRAWLDRACHLGRSAYEYCRHRFFRRERFTFQGKTYPYFCGMYGVTWKSERTVEIPIIMGILRQYHPQQVLEVGNVLSHYCRFKHDILDKYERAHGVINEDAVTFRPPKKYSLIVSISTLEHIGWQEDPREPDKILRAVDNLMGLLMPGGMFVFTVPVGYCEDLDRLLREERIPSVELHFMKRAAIDAWIEAEKRDVNGVRHGSSWPGANALAVGIIRKKQ